MRKRREGGIDERSAEGHGWKSSVKSRDRYDNGRASCSRSSFTTSTWLLLLLLLLLLPTLYTTALKSNTPKLLCLSFYSQADRYHRSPSVHVQGHTTVTEVRLTRPWEFLQVVSCHLYFFLGYIWSGFCFKKLDQHSATTCTGASGVLHVRYLQRDNWQYKDDRQWRESKRERWGMTAEVPDQTWTVWMSWFMVSSTRESQMVFVIWLITVYLENLHH